MNSKDNIKITNDDVFIKASSSEEMELKKKELQARLDQQTSRCRQESIKERDKYETHVSTALPGATVLGKLSAEEVNAVKTNNQGALLRMAAKRHAAMQKRIRDRR